MMMTGPSCRGRAVAEPTLKSPQGTREAGGATHPQAGLTTKLGQVGATGRVGGSPSQDMLAQMLQL